MVSPRVFVYRRDLREGREAEFFKGASLTGPLHLFDSSPDGQARCAIELHEGDRNDEDALRAHLRAAATLSESTARR